MVDLLNRPISFICKSNTTSQKYILWKEIEMQNKSVLFTHLLSLVTILLKAYSQAYILMTLMPEMTSFMIRTRWSVTRADLNLGGDDVEGGEEGGEEGGKRWRGGEEREERKERGEW